MAHPFGNDPAKIEGYKRFWKREPAGRPLVGFSLKTWLPLEEFAASRSWRGLEYLTPELIRPAEFVDDQERLLREGERIEDDIIRGASPSQAVAWISPMFGVPLRVLDESTLPPDQSRTWDEVVDLHLDRGNPWYRKYMEFSDVLVRAANGRYPVSHGTLHGPFDEAAILRGHKQMIYDMYDDPDKLVDLMRRVRVAFDDLVQTQWAGLPKWQGGYFDAQYSLWAPGPIVRMQEDASGLFSPELYRRLLQPIDREWAAGYECSFIHLHSTSMFILEDFLAIEEIRAFEVNRDVSGPPLEEMVPYYRRVQESGRPLLIRGSFTPEELDMLLSRLAPEGLFLYIMIGDMPEMASLRKVLGM